MKKLLSKLFQIDYDIIGEYYLSDRNGRQIKKYKKRYNFRRWGGKKWYHLPTL